MTVPKAHLMFSFLFEFSILLEFCSVDKDFNPPQNRLNYIPGIVDEEGHDGNKPCICKNKKKPMAMLANQRPAVQRIHFFKLFLGKILNA